MLQDSFNRVKGLKDNLEGLIEKLQKNITQDFGSDAEEDSPMKSLGKFKNQFNDLQNSKTSQSKVLKEHELSDVATLFKKLSAQFERF